LPTSMFLLRILRLPLLSSEEMESAVSLQMDKISPFPGDELAMGWEVLAEDDEHATVFASATPIRYLEMVGAALQQAGVRAFRLDVTLLAAWRALRNQGALAEGAGRQVVLFVHGDEWDILVLDEGLPVQARGIGRLLEEGDLTRELTLSIFQAEMEFGLRSLRDVLVISDQPPTEKQLEAIRAATSVNVHFVAPTPGNTAADGLGLRHVEGAKLDMTPPTWRARERMEAVRRRMLLGLGLAAGLWVILAGTLFLGGVVTRQLTDIQKNRERAFIAEYEHVRDTRERVYLIDQYEDRSHSLLESLRTIVTQQPEGIELSSLTYRRDAGCKLTGEAPDTAPIYTFKERLQTTPPFTACKLVGVAVVPGSQRQRFELDAQFGEKSP